MPDPDRAFYARRTSIPVPGSIGPSADLYLDTLKMNGKALLTRYDYHRELTRLGQMFPAKEPHELDTFDIELFLRTRCAGCGPHSVRRVLAAVRGYFKYLHERGRVPTNPVTPINRPVVPDPEPTYWDPDEIRKILAAPMEPRDHLLLETLARTGQRQSAVRTLKWEHVRLDLKEPELWFPVGSSKGGKMHEVPMDKEVLHDFIVYRRMTNPTSADYVFRSRQGGNRPISSQRVIAIIEQACRKAGVRVAGAHEFRRSCITNLLQAGVPFDVVSRDIARHANPQTTMRHYRGAHKGRVREALRGLPY
jgi:integrase/recombinase XerD